MKMRQRYGADRANERAVTANIMNALLSFICPDCGARSFNTNDIHNRYCARCHIFIESAHVVARAYFEHYPMLYVGSKISGLPMNIWLRQRSKAQHGAQIKVQMNHQFKSNFVHTATVSVPDIEVVDGQLSLDDCDLVRRYVAHNLPAILDHWNEAIDGAQLSAALKPLRL